MGSRVRVLLKKLQMEAEQLPSANVPSMPSATDALQRSIIQDNILSSTKTIVVKMQYFICSFILVHVMNILKYRGFFFLMDKCGLCLMILSH